MSIEALSAATSTTSTAQTTTPKGSKDEFLKLFMAQLQHQDPLDPKSGADMVAQLAQFSAVEQAAQTNSTLSELAAAQASNASASLSNLVGRDCQGVAGDFTIDRPGTPPPPLDLTATGPMKGASVVITGADGKELRRIPIADGTTSTTVAWDGRDTSGQLVPAGSYKIAVDPGATTASIQSRWHGSIDAIELTPDGPRLRMGGVLIAPSDIRTIGSAGQGTPS
ncbi:MAG: hypothetical protein NT062_06665 [Proteobacteria bacterium]|nr:hypothetical protein [Pseudomonadota bacterium]